MTENRAPRAHELRMRRWQQQFDATALADIDAELQQQLAAFVAAHPTALRPGMRVAITGGSRGITDMLRVLKHCVQWLQQRECVPFIIPAMGSHGGGTAAGQCDVLASYGITEAAMGCAIEASMDVVEMPRGACPVPVFMDARAAAADATIVINRIKPHTDFHGDYESGLMKMIAIGLGKHAQASALHSFGVPGIRDMMPAVAKRVLAHGNVVLGIGIVENAYDQTCQLACIAAADIPQQEPALLAEARRRMPALPIDTCDILLVDAMGKNISGVGIDTNIIGRMRVRGQPEPATPRINAIVVHRLTAASHGNACGVGLADVISPQLADDINHAITRTNISTSGFFQRGAIPLVADSDGHSWELALRAAWAEGNAAVRALRIRDTLHCAEFFATAALEQELIERGCAPLSDYQAMYDDNVLIPWSAA